MMKHIYLMTLSAAVILLAASCSKKEESGETGSYGVYLPAQQTSFVHEMTEPKVDTVYFSRINTSGEITVPVKLSDPSGIFQLGEVKFSDGQQNTYAVLSSENAREGVTYDLRIIIDDPKYYSPDPQYRNIRAFSVAVDGWILMGKCTMEDSYLDVEKSLDLYQRKYAPHCYSMESPYPNSGYLTFRELQVGEVLHADDPALATTVTVPGLIYFDPFETGKVDADYGDAVTYVHPSDFVEYSDESLWKSNTVTQYQKDGTAGAVNLSPVIYFNRLGGGIEYDSRRKIKITFPGVTPVDYSLELEAYPPDSATGITYVNVIRGTDVILTKAAVYEGVLSEEAVRQKAEKIAHFDEPAAVEIHGGKFDTKCAGTGRYTMVAVGFNRDSAVNVASIPFSNLQKGDKKKMAFSMTLKPGEKNPETTLEYVISGKDIAEVKMGLVSESQYSYGGKEMLSSHMEELGTEELNQINTSNLKGAFTGLTPGYKYIFRITATDTYFSFDSTCTVTTEGTFEIKKEDLYGTYGGEAFSSGIPETVSFKIVQSDVEDYDFKFTEFFGHPCDSAVYATLLTPEDGGQYYAVYFYNFSSWDQFPVYNDAKLGLVYYKTPGFTVTGDGILSRPMNFIYQYGTNRLSESGETFKWKTWDELYVTKNSSTKASAPSQRVVYDSSHEAAAVPFTLSPVSSETATKSDRSKPVFRALERR